MVNHRKLLAAAVAEAAKREKHLALPQQADGAIKDDQTCQLCEMAVTYLKVSLATWFGRTCMHTVVRACTSDCHQHVLLCPWSLFRDIACSLLKLSQPLVCSLPSRATRR